jgi:hypothetical protein
VAHNKVGDVLGVQGNLVGALTAYRESLAIAAHLSEADPSNAVWQRDLFVGYAKLAGTLETSNPPKARQFWQKCYRQIDVMKKHGILNPADENLLEIARQKAGE